MQNCLSEECCVLSDKIIFLYLPLRRPRPTHGCRTNDDDDDCDDDDDDITMVIFTTTIRPSGLKDIYHATYMKEIF